MKQNPTYVATKLYEEYKDINENVPFINSGGCGIFAEHLYNVLSKLGLNPIIITITNNAELMDERIEKDLDYNGSWIEHIMIKLDTMYIDCTGIYDDLSKTRWWGQTTDKLGIEQLSRWNSEAKRWNDTFNRKKIKTIEKKLADAYKKLEKDLVESI